MAEDVTFRPLRGFADFVAKVTIEEVHTDELTITNHPVEQGAAVTDHAFKNQARLSLQAGWSNSDPEADSDPTYVTQLYERLLALQSGRVPFDVYTGKRRYRNMLLQGLATTTSEKTENVLIVTATMREIITVTTQATTVPPNSVQSTPSKTGGVRAAGTKQLAPAPQANKSALAVLAGK